MLNTLLLIITSDINIMIAESTEATQVEDLVAGIGAEDSAVQTLTGKPSVVEIAVASVAVEATTTITVLEVLATTSVSDKPVADLAPVQIELTLISRPILERGSGVHQQGCLQPLTSWRN